MTDSALVAKAAIIATVPLLAAFGVRFYRRQQCGALGGAISRAKAYWLPFAIWFWFVVCPAIGIDGLVRGGVDEPAARALAAFGVFMWIRGAAEMVMLYVTKNWRPPIGIGHDVLCVLLVLGLAAPGVVELRETTAASLSAYALCAVAVLSLGVEIHHAHSFYVACGGKTTGDGGIWFADDHAEEFRKINRNTLVWNCVLTALVGAIVVRFLVA